MRQSVARRAAPPPPAAAASPGPGRPPPPPLASGREDTPELFRRHGPLFWWSFLLRPAVFVGDAGLVRQLVNGEHDIGGAGGGPELVGGRGWVGEGVW